MRHAPLLKKLGPVWLLLALWLLCPAVSGPTLVVRMGPVVGWLIGQPQRGVVPWTLLMTAIIGLGLLPAYANTIVCGWVYGWGLGCLSAMTSYLLGACLSALVVRRVASRSAAAVLEASEQAQRLQQALLRSSRARALLVVSLFRLTGFPFTAGTLVLSSGGVTLPQNLLGTLCGMTPRIAVATWFASRFAATGARDLQTLLRNSSNPGTLLLSVGFGLAVLALIAQIGNRALRQLAERPSAPSP